MKRIIAILLMLLLIFVMMACSGPAELNDGTGLAAEANTDETETAQMMEEQKVEAEQNEEKQEAAQGLQMWELVEEYIDFSHYDENQENYYQLKHEFRPDYSQWNPANGFITIDGNVKLTTDETKLS